MFSYCKIVYFAKRIEDQSDKNIKPGEIVEPSKPENHLSSKDINHSGESQVKEERNTINGVKPRPKVHSIFN